MKIFDSALRNCYLMASGEESKFSEQIEECLYEMSKGLGICTGCFNGKYPLDPPTEDIRGDYQK